MPRGMHPNSRKALEENRHRGSFTAENALENSEKALKAKARNRTFREEFEQELAAMISDGSGKKVSVKSALTKTAVQKALRGDLRALEFIRDTVGEKPVETVNIQQPDFSALDKLMEEMGNDPT